MYTYYRTMCVNIFITYISYYSAGGIATCYGLDESGIESR